MIRFVFLASGLLLTSIHGWAAPQGFVTKVDEMSGEEAVFATVGDIVITRAEFEAVYQRAKRQKFYHGKPTEKDEEAFRRKTTDDLIDRNLLLQEAKRRGIQPDEEKINSALDTYRQRYANSQRWQLDGDKMLAELGKKLREDALLQGLGNQLRQSNQPDDAQLKRFYQNNLDKFTEPETQRISLILLKVDPSSSKEVWDATVSEAAELGVRLRKGEEFSALAAQHSDDVTAQKGGDMGYLHKGMLGQAAESVVEKMVVGEVSKPVRVLEGIAIFRFDDRKQARLRSLAEVKDRAVALWQREKTESAWKSLKQHLRDSTEIKIHTTQPSRAQSFGKSNT